jgi:MFS family permease
VRDDTIGRVTAPPRFAALRSPHYRPYFAWTLLSMTADNIEHVISYWVIYQAFHSPALAGFAVISHWVPFLLFSVWAGALADRRDCRALIQVAQALYMLASAAWGLLFLAGALETWHAVVILLVHGAAGVVQAPSSQLIIHDMVEPADLPSAIRLLASARYLAILLGPAIGGGMMLLLGPAWGLLANVLVYVPLTVFLTRVPFTGHLHRRGAPPRPARLGLGDTASLAEAVRADRRILTMLLLGGATSFFVGNAFQAQMPEYAADLGMDDAGAWYSVLLAANAAGAVLGAVLLESTNVLRPGARAAIVCATAWAITIGAFPWARTSTAAVALLVLAGVFNIAFTSMAQTLVQLLAPERVRGTVVGWFNTAMLGLRAGSGVTVGVLGALIDIHWSLTLSALAVVATAVLLLAMEPRAAPARAGR